jgi:uncharacterized cupin superfamily protein
MTPTELQLSLTDLQSNKGRMTWMGHVAGIGDLGVNRRIMKPSNSNTPAGNMGVS